MGTDDFKSQLEEQYQEEFTELLTNPRQPSVYEDYGVFKLLIMRRLEIEDKTLNLVPEVFILKEKEIYYKAYASGDFQLLSKNVHDLYVKLDSFFSKNLKILNGFASEVVNLEEYLFNRSVPSFFMDLWFDLQKDLARIESDYFRIGIVYREFFRKFNPSMGKFVDEFSDIEETISFQTAHIESLQTRLESLHNYYESIKNERLNKTILFLTIISGVFLPLNLIVGFFGMNTEGMYLSQNKEATYTVVLIMAATLVISLLGFPILKTIDKWILGRILGRYNFYRTIMDRIEKIDQNFKIK